MPAGLVVRGDRHGGEAACQRPDLDDRQGAQHSPTQTNLPADRAETFRVWWWQEGGRREGVDAAQELLVSEGELSSVKELAFAFQRAASRLVEVSSGGSWIL